LRTEKGLEKSSALREIRHNPPAKSWLWANTLVLPVLLLNAANYSWLWANTLNPQLKFMKQNAAAKCLCAWGVLIRSFSSSPPVLHAHPSSNKVK
jgi:hypothetical protein